MALQTIADVGDALLGVMFDHLVLVMTGKTSPGCQVRLVTVGAGIGVSMTHGEAVRAVVRGRSPGGGVVATAAIRAEHAGMVRGFGVASGTSRRQRADVITVTLSARQTTMRASEREAGEVMVEVGGLPGRGAVARTAIRSELAVVIVVLCMTCATVLRRAFEDAVDMTG